jgi:hydroxypyruvate reductase
VSPARLHDLARRLAALALTAVDPERLVRDELARRGPALRCDAVLALGKAAAGLARGARALPPIPLRPRRLLIRPHASPVLLEAGWEQMTGGHPLPDRQSAAAGARLERWLAEIEEGQTLLALVSGGSSACLELPAPGLTLDDLAATQRALLASGLPIGTVNTVRKHLSALKGGGALRRTRGRVLAYLLSDVLGDDPSAIGSGPFAADPSTYWDALAAVRPLAGVPDRVRRHLESGVRGEILETVKPGDPALARVETVVLGSARTARAAVAAELRRQGFSVEEGDLEGEASTAAAGLVARGRSLPGETVAVVLGGETTVTLQGPAGRGGRNTELALAAAQALSGVTPGVEEVVLALATDGEDASSRSAGGVVDGHVWEAARSARVEPEAALARHDSYTALRAVPGALLDTGITGTNVGDLAVYLRRPAGIPGLG